MASVPNLTHELFEKMTRGSFHARFLAFMKACHLSEVRVNYSGGGDSGGVDSITCFGKERKEVLDRLESAIQDIDSISDPIYNKFGSFADGGGYSVDGAIVYKDNKVVLEGTEHHYEYDEKGEEGESRDEDFCEGVFDNTLPDYSGEQDFCFVNLYASEYLRNKLPEEFHNRILTAAALDSDDAAVEYLEKFGGKK